MASFSIKYLILLITAYQVIIIDAAPFQYRTCYLPLNAALTDVEYNRQGVDNETIEFGSNIENFGIINAKCNDGKALIGASTLRCKNGEWDHNLPMCENICDGTFVNRLSLRAICEYRGNITNCPNQIRKGTNIHLSCAFGYSRQPKVQQLKCLSSGELNQSPIRCEMECGRVPPLENITAANGTELEASKAPWHVAIFGDNKASHDYVCAGSIVSPTVVISAAHCFWNAMQAQARNSNEFQIIAGGNSKTYSTEQSEYTQLVNVKEIVIPNEYQLGHLGDMAFIKLEKPLKFSEYVAPICIPKNLRNTASRYVLANRNGFVTAFRSTNQLERINMMTIAYNECLLRSPKNDRIVDDKFCAYTTGSNLVCRGDGGGGFTFEKKDDISGFSRYSLMGAISSTPRSTNECVQPNNQTFVEITNIFHMSSRFKTMLLDAIREDEKLF